MASSNGNGGLSWPLGMLVNLALKIMKCGVNRLASRRDQRMGAIKFNIGDIDQEPNPE